jgi:glycosyltransferase involved in cell wall biosynthesis
MRIAWLSDLDPNGSGYYNISVPLCNLLSEHGYEIKALGLGYTGQEHYHKFSIIPTRDLREAQAQVINLVNMWGVEVLVVALDIPLQKMVYYLFPNAPFKYLGIMPIEADPLCMSWAMILMAIDKPLIISEFGTNEAHKAGVMNAEHIPIGIDMVSWKTPTKEERLTIRASFGIEPDEFVVLTNADNQERKNLAKGIDIVAEFSIDKKVRYVMVTREYNMVGWNLRDYAQLKGINDRFMLIERGMNHQGLWNVYAIADTFLLPSKAEGLGMTLLEAMATGVICVATDCTGMSELLADDRGELVKYDLPLYVDPFGNGNRYFINQEDCVNKLNLIYTTDQTSRIEKARKYVEGRTWDKAASILEKALMELKESKSEVFQGKTAS